jgi:hypothetical protein
MDFQEADRRYDELKRQFDSGAALLLQGMQ